LKGPANPTRGGGLLRPAVGLLGGAAAAEEGVEWVAVLFCAAVPTAISNSSSHI
jgi:hypothetical protein